MDPFSSSLLLKALVAIIEEKLETILCHPEIPHHTLDIELPHKLHSTMDECFVIGTWPAQPATVLLGEPTTKGKNNMLQMGHLRQV